MQRWLNKLQPVSSSSDDRNRRQILQNQTGTTEHAQQPFQDSSYLKREKGVLFPLFYVKRHCVLHWSAPLAADFPSRRVDEGL